MNTFIAIQSTYHEVQLALMNNEGIIQQINIDKKQASKLVIVHMKHLLETYGIDLQSIPYIAVNQGPGPFTTLRVVIASVNGISFASNIPLIGIDAFDAMLTEWSNPTYPTTVVLFNAFSHDVYFAIEQPNNPTRKGYNNIDRLLEQCKELPGTIRFLGNGTHLHREKINHVLGDRAFISAPLPEYCSVKQIGIIGQQQWENDQKGSKQLLPLYLKKHPAEQQLIDARVS